MDPRRNRGGFTMAEVLLTLAILAVLMAVAIPGVLAARRQLKMMELNDTAREIFLAAQNTLTAHRAAGTLDPAQGDPDGEFRWLSQDNAGYLLPAGSIEAGAAGNFYQIKYNPKSAAVLEVYYAEQPLPDVRGGSYSNDDAGGPALRRAEQIGYYNGQDLEITEIDELPTLDGDLLVNKEELYAHVKIPSEYVGKVTLTLILEELDSSGEPVDGDPLVFGGTDTKFDIYGEWTLVLDSLNGPQHFTTTCPGITPGANIRATAVLDWSDAPSGSPSKLVDTDNSLFASRAAGDGADKVTIAYPRHLQNLDSGYSGVQGRTLDAVQTSVLPWPAGIDFQSITNNDLRSYDGRSLEIQGLHGTNGLFKYFTAGSLSNIFIADSQISGGDGDIINEYGVLAGTIRAAVIKNCRVYAKTPPYDVYITSPDGFIGGLFGRAYQITVSDSFAALPLIAGNSSTLGGLIANAEDCEIYNSYAVVDQMKTLTTGTSNASMFVGEMSGTNTIQNCYAVGNIAVSGNICGFTNGHAKISDSYCAVTYEGATGSVIAAFTYGVNASDLSGCFYLAAGVNDSFATPLSFGAEGWASLSGTWADIPDTQSHPYRPELLGRAYPFPGLKLPKSVSKIPHYGSWPVQTVDEIKAFRADQGSDTVDYLICPTGGSISFWAEPRNSGQPVDIRVDEPKCAFPDSTADLTAVLGSAESDSPRTQITVSSNTSGVYAVEVSAGGAKLWVPVIVCSAKMTLTGTANDDLEHQKENSATLLNGQPDSNVLPLRTDEKAAFSAELTVDLPCGTVNNGMNDLYDAATAPVTTQTWTEIEAKDWLGFRVAQGGEITGFGPGITLNERVADGVYRLKADDSGDHLYHVMGGGTNNKADHANSETLTVTGQSAGIAAVSACWAMDSRLTVTGNIDVIGAQAFIHSAAASATFKAHDDNGVLVEKTVDLGSKDNYPYLLAIKPAPQDAVALSFTSWLSSDASEDTTQSPATQTWTWLITDPAGKPVGTSNKDDTTIPEDGVVFTFAPGELPEKLSDQIFTVWLKDTAPNARYRVQMTYSYTTSAGSTYSTSDFMYVTVTRTTSYDDDDPGCYLDVPASLTLEQITWGDEGVPAPADYKGGPLNVGTVTGTVKRAADTQLLWYLKVDEDKKIMLTGMDPKKPEQVFGPDGSFIAELLWTPDYPTGEKAPPGGVITVTAQNCDYYGDTPLTFTLLAQARDNGDLADRKEVPVYIMPKLKIDPASKVLISSDKTASYPFSANRTEADSDFGPYHWAVDGVSQAGTTSLISPSVAPGSGKTGRRYVVTLDYGPFRRASATLIVRNTSGNSVDACVNADVVIGDTPYFLIEKDVSRILEVSYQNKTSPCHIDSSNLDEFSDYFSYTAETNTVESFTQYHVTGTKFTPTALELNWYIVRNTGNQNTTQTCNAYVVGVEFQSDSFDPDTPDKKEIILDDSKPTADLSIASYFPAELGTGTVTITSSNEAVLSPSKLEFTPNGTDPKVITVTAEKYGTTVLTATYNVGGYTYKDTCKVTVNAPEDTYRAVLEPCSEELRDTLCNLFGDIITDTSDLIVYAKYPVKDDDGNVTRSKFLPTLLTGHFTGTKDSPDSESQVENFFGHDALYLKAYLTDSAGSIQSPNEIVGDMAFFSDNPALIDIYLADDPDTLGVFYLRVQARPGMGTPSGDPVTISAKFGTLPAADFETMVFSDPTVVIIGQSGTDVTNGHTVIDGFDPADPQTHTFQAALYPWIQKKEVDEDGSVRYTKLDDLVWFTEFPDDGYQADTFLTLSPCSDPQNYPNCAIGPTCMVTIKASPGCKVAINVQSKRAYDAGKPDLTVSAHALVFLPELHKNDPEP